MQEQFVKRINLNLNKNVHHFPVENKNKTRIKENCTRTEPWGKN